MVPKSRKPSAPPMVKVEAIHGVPALSINTYPIEGETVQHQLTNLVTTLFEIHSVCSMTFIIHCILSRQSDPGNSVF